MAFGLGYRPDPVDTRDFDACDPASEGILKIGQTPSVLLPPSGSNRQFTKTLNQGGLGSCTCNGAVQVVRSSEIKQAVDSGMDIEVAQTKIPFGSRLWLYYLARAIDGNTREDTGTFIRNVYRVLNEFGFPPESVWPYSDDATTGKGPFTRHPPANVYRQAFDQRDATGDKNLVDYARITTNGYARVDDVKRAIVEGHLVEFGTNVSEDFCSDMSANGGKPIDPPIGLRIAGGHAMCIGGYTPEGALILNSWGTDFGDEGWFLMSWDYITWTETSDLWIGRRSPMFMKGAA